MPLFSQSSNVENDHYLVEWKYADDYWYRVYSDGWIEQGGVIPFDWDNRDKYCSFAKPLKIKIVTFLFSADARWPDAHIYRAYASDLMGFRIGVDAWEDHSGVNTSVLFNFYACGF